MNLSHIPLAWMIHESARVGLRFNQDKLNTLFHLNAEQLVTLPGISDGNLDGCLCNDQLKSSLNLAAISSVVHDTARFTNKIQAGLRVKSTSAYGDESVLYIDHPVMKYLPFFSWCVVEDRPLEMTIKFSKRFQRRIPPGAILHKSATLRRDHSPQQRLKASKRLDFFGAMIRVTRVEGCLRIYMQQRVQDTVNTSSQWNG